MDSIELQLDVLLFDADVIARTAYRYSGDFYVLVKSPARIWPTWQRGSRLTPVMTVCTPKWHCRPAICSAC